MFVFYEHCHSKLAIFKYFVSAENQEMQFGALVSTSNKLEEGAKEVTVTTDSPVLWTMGIKKLKLKET